MKQKRVNDQIGYRVIAPARTSVSVIDMNLFAPGKAGSVCRNGMLNPGGNIAGMAVNQPTNVLFFPRGQYHPEFSACKICCIVYSRITGIVYSEMSGILCSEIVTVAESAAILHNSSYN